MVAVNGSRCFGHASSDCIVRPLTRFSDRWLGWWSGQRLKIRDKKERMKERGGEIMD
jgi:hypothetical protein